jgi:hypothetical protein
MKRLLFQAAAALTFSALLGAVPARANMIIDVTYGGGVPTAAETAFNTVVADYENLYSNNITVNLQVDFASGGLGASSSSTVAVSYTAFKAALAANATANPNNIYIADAVAALPGSDPLGSGSVILRTAEARALGFTNATILIGNVGPTDDSTLTFNSDANTFEYNGVAQSGLYDFQDVAAHELDEALGVGSALTGLADGAAVPTNYYDAEDYFRYSATAVRDITTSAGATVYFSYNGGATDVAKFNQDNTYGDRNDWNYANTSCPGSSPGPYIQDAIGCTDSAVKVGKTGSPETIVLNTLGYDLASPVPEPGTILLGCSGLALLAVLRRHSR